MNKHALNKHILIVKMYILKKSFKNVLKKTPYLFMYIRASCGKKNFPFFLLLSTQMNIMLVKLCS